MKYNNILFYGQKGFILSEIVIITQFLIKKKNVLYEIFTNNNYISAFQTFISMICTLLFMKITLSLCKIDQYQNFNGVMIKEALSTFLKYFNIKYIIANISITSVVFDHKSLIAVTEK